MSTPVAAPECPRCGYDLSGEVATWTTRCPLGGICPECGHRLQWREIFDPTIADVRWFFEHRDGPAPRAAGVTWLWTLLPWIFWRRVRLEGRVRPWRAWLWILVLLLALHTVAATLACVSTYAIIQSTGPTSPIDHDWVFYVSLWTYPIVAFNRVGAMGTVRVLPTILGPPAFALPAMGFFAAFPALLVVLPHTRRAAKVRAAHVHRAVAFGLAWLLPLAAFRVARNVAYAYDTLVYWLASQPRVMFGPSPTMLRGETATWLGVGTFAWIGAWWLCCFTLGWRLRHGPAVWLLLGVAAALVAGIVTLRDSFLGVLLDLAG